MIRQVSQNQAVRRASRLPQVYRSGGVYDGNASVVKSGKERDMVVVGNLVYDYGTQLCWVRNPALIVPGGTGSESLTAKGVWSNSLNYVVNDLVAVDFDFYICIAGHTNQEPPNAAYWVKTPWAGSPSDPILLNFNTPVADIFTNCLMTYAGVGPWSETNKQGWRMPSPIEVMSILGVEDVEFLHPLFNDGTDWDVGILGSFLTSDIYYEPGVLMEIAIIAFCDFRGAVMGSMPVGYLSELWTIPVRSLI